MPTVAVVVEVADVAGGRLLGVPFTEQITDRAFQIGNRFGVLGGDVMIGMLLAGARLIGARPGGAAVPDSDAETGADGQDSCGQDCPAAAGHGIKDFRAMTKFPPGNHLTTGILVV